MINLISLYSCERTKKKDIAKEFLNQAAIKKEIFNVQK
jgi:hypothetical protein